jgi:acyl carrier protein
MMTREDIKEIVVDVVSTHLAPSIEVTETANLETDLGADSLDKVEITMALEEKFNMDISDEKLEQVHTVEDAIELIYSMTNENAEA